MQRVSASTPRPPRPLAPETFEYPLRTPFADLPPPLGYYAQLPKDLQRELLLRLSYEDILGLCKSGWFSWLCKDVDFWAKKANVDRETFVLTAAKTKQDFPMTYLDLRTRAGEIFQEFKSGFAPRTKATLIWSELLYQRMNTMPDEELKDILRYIFASVKTPEYIISYNFQSFAETPRLLCWLASLGIHITSPKIARIAGDIVYIAHNHGGMEAVRCLEALSDINWKDAFVPARQLELVRYIIEEKGMRDKVTIRKVYTQAVRAGHMDIARYLENILKQ